MAAHVPSAARENLTQFVSFFPQVDAKISDHDVRENQLEESCRAYYTAILESEVFQKVFESVASESPRVTGREFTSNFGAYSVQTDLTGILAEYLVNNVERLPRYYSTADLWNHYRDRFLPVASDPSLAHLRVATEQAGHNMLKAVDELASLLKEKRSELSLQFDVELGDVR